MYVCLANWASFLAALFAKFMWRASPCIRFSTVQWPQNLHCFVFMLDMCTAKLQVFCFCDADRIFVRVRVVCHFIVFWKAYVGMAVVSLKTDAHFSYYIGLASNYTKSDKVIFANCPNPWFHLKRSWTLQRSKKRAHNNLRANQIAHSVNVSIAFHVWQKLVDMRFEM